MTYVIEDGLAVPSGGYARIGMFKPYVELRVGQSVFLSMGQGREVNFGVISPHHPSFLGKLYKVIYTEGGARVWRVK